MFGPFLGRNPLWFDSRKRPLDLRILDGRLREVWLLVILIVYMDFSFIGLHLGTRGTRAYIWQTGEMRSHHQFLCVDKL